MKCLACGAELPEGTIFCTSCGTKLEPVQDSFVQPVQNNYSEPAYQQPTPDFQQPAPDFQQPAPDFQQPAPAMQPTAPYNASPAKPADPGKNLGTASLILGIVSLVFNIILGWLAFFFVPTNLVALGCGIAGVITGSKAKKACEAAGVTPSTMTKAGFICSAIGLVLGALLTIAAVGFIVVLIFAALSSY